MTATVETTTYTIEGRLLEVCTCAAICPCWIGEDPDGGSCDSALAWYVDSGTVRGVDVSDRGLALSVFIPGNVLAGNWKAVVHVDDRCSEEQQEALLAVFTGALGGPIADLAALIGEVVAVERAPMTFTVEGGAGTLKVGDVIEAHLTPFQGATGKTTTLSETVFSTIPGSPTFPGKASIFRQSGAKLGRPDLDISGRNSVQGAFRFSA
ncbi:MAG: hypothetical protein QOJ68_607 [Blastococcus sp.]|jgi:hypothetical protein|nr:hypothetical protein [Blastococcus sp.]